MTPDDRAFLTGLFDAAVSAADPYLALRANLPDRPRGRMVVIGAGKGAAQLAAAFEDLWDGPLKGVVVRSPRATEITKLLINAAEGEDRERAIEAVAGAVVAGSADLAAGLAAFREKRKPNFEGKA